MDYITTLAAIAMVIGGIVAFLGVIQLMGKKVFHKGFMSQHYAPLATGIVLVVVGFMLGGYPIIEGYLYGTSPAAQTTTTTTTTTTGYQYATFTITPSCQSAGNLTLNTAKDTFTLPALAWTTTHSIKTLSNATFVQPSMKFLINPIGWAGSNALDLATVYYEFTPLDQTIDPTAGGTYYFLSSTGSNRNARFNNTGNTICQYGSGETTMLLTSSATVYVNCTLSVDACSRIDSTYEPVLSTITFHNADHSWSQSYTLSFFITAKKAV